MSERMTKQRAAVAEALTTAQTFMSAQEIHDLLHSSGAKVGLATVYRNLQVMANAGAVDVVRGTEGEALYRRCEREAHHHHLVCERCGRAVEISGSAVEQWAQAMASEHGFTQVTHTVELSGLCPRCSQQR